MKDRQSPPSPQQVLNQLLSNLEAETPSGTERLRMPSIHIAGSVHQIVIAASGPIHVTTQLAHRQQDAA